MRKNALILVLLMISASLAGCVGSDDDDDGVMNNKDKCPNTPAGETVDYDGCSQTQHFSRWAVLIDELAFRPANWNITVGDLVSWSNLDGGRTHTVTADDGTFDSGNIAMDHQYEFRFNTVGTYSYVCSIHSSMTGTITVNAETTSGDTSGDGNTTTDDNSTT